MVINDGSTDGTERASAWKMASITSVCCKTWAIGGAVQTGYLYAWKMGYDIAVQFDGDGQHDLNSLPPLLEPVIQNRCDFCSWDPGLWTDPAISSPRPLRRLGIQYLSGLIRLLTGTKVTDPTSGFRAANRAVIRELADYYPADYPSRSLLYRSKKCATASRRCR